MKICVLLRAVELFFAMDEAAQVAEWEHRCRVIAEAVEGIAGVEASFTIAYENKFPQASLLGYLLFGNTAPRSVGDVVRTLKEGEPSILVSGEPQTLLDSEAEIIADHLQHILTP